MSFDGRGPRNTRLVYSTESGDRCPRCGSSRRVCRCESLRHPDDAVPSRIVAKLRMERKGRGGKVVTLVYGLPNNAAFLRALCGDLKRACGTGGAVVEGGVELQGELCERVRDALAKKGYVVKG